MPQVTHTAMDGDSHNRGTPNRLLDDDDLEAELDLKYGAQSVVSLIGPVSICMLVVVLTIRSVSYFAENPEQQYL